MHLPKSLRSWPILAVLAVIVVVLVGWPVISFLYTEDQRIAQVAEKDGDKSAGAPEKEKGTTALPNDDDRPATPQAKRNRRPRENSPATPPTPPTPTDNVKDFGVGKDPLGPKNLSFGSEPPGTLNATRLDTLKQDVDGVIAKKQAGDYAIWVPAGVTADELTKLVSDYDKDLKRNDRGSARILKGRTAEERFVGLFLK
jgi:hypothetical protein